MEIKSINVQELKRMTDAGESFHLIDVREQYEYDQANLNAELIPLSIVPGNIEKFEREGKVIIHCRSGARSANLINQLQQMKGLDNLYNLEGGILAWAAQIDPTLPAR